MVIAIVMVLMGAWAQTASAVVFMDQGSVKVSAPNKEGLVHVNGDPCVLDQYLRDIQFCPDQVKYTVGCGLDWRIGAKRISQTEAIFQLDMAAVARGQRAFNFKNGALWSQVSAAKTGEGVIVEMSDPNPDSEDGRGGCHYVYIADLPAGSYVPNKPELCGGGYVKPVAKPTPAVAAPIADMSQAVVKSPDAQVNQSKQVANVKVSVKGNNNTTVTVTKQQKNITQQKGATVRNIKIKGNNNIIRACTYNINYTVQNMGQSVASDNCAGCHNSKVWPHLTNRAFENCTTSVIRKNVEVKSTESQHRVQKQPTSSKKAK